MLSDIWESGAITYYLMEETHPPDSSLSSGPNKRTEDTHPLPTHLTSQEAPTISTSNSMQGSLLWLCECWKGESKVPGPTQPPLHTLNKGKDGVWSELDPGVRLAIVSQPRPPPTNSFPFLLLIVLGGRQAGWEGHYG